VKKCTCGSRIDPRKLIAEPGAFMMMDDGIQMETFSVMEASSTED
jgi:hypothetical protein